MIVYITTRSIHMHLEMYVWGSDSSGTPARRLLLLLDPQLSRVSEPTPVPCWNVASKTPNVTRRNSRKSLVSGRGCHGYVVVRLSCCNE